MIKAKLRGIFHVRLRSAFCASILLLAFYPVSSLAQSQIELIDSGLKEGRIAVTYTENQNSDIYLIDFSNNKISPLISSPARDSNPRWSNDGKLLAFDSDRSGKSGIYIHSLVEPYNDPKLIAEFAGAQQPDWSPDDKYLVFTVRNKNNSGRSLVAANTDGSGLRRLLKASHSITYPRWSPRGTEILYSSNESWPGWDLAILELQNRNAKTLSKGVKNFVRGSWHPSSGSVLFSYGSGRKFDLWKIDKGSRDASEVAVHQGRIYDGEWILGGRGILFAAEDVQGSGHYEVFLYDKKSGRSQQLTRSKGSIRDISWSPFTLPPLKPKPLVEETNEETQDAL